MRKLWSATLILMFIATIAAAQMEKKEAAAPQKDPAAAQKAAMEAMMRAGTPGEAHKKLNGMVGTFDAKVRYWPAPGAPVSEAAGKSVNEWILGGRWVQQRFEGTMMGSPFSGIGFTGYDNVKHMYVGSWMDSMSTAMMNSTGNPDSTGKVFEFTSMMIDPVSGESATLQEKVTVADNDHHTFEMWVPGPDGLMFRNVEITYTRKK